MNPFGKSSGLLVRQGEPFNGGPAADRLVGSFITPNELLDLLITKEKELKATLAAYGPYADILGDVIGTGPWFDAYVVNLAGLATGEFVNVDEAD